LIRSPKGFDATRIGDSSGGGGGGRALSSLLPPAPAPLPPPPAPTARDVLADLPPAILEGIPDGRVFPPGVLVEEAGVATPFLRAALGVPRPPMPTGVLCTVAFCELFEPPLPRPTPVALAAAAAAAALLLPAAAAAADAATEDLRRVFDVTTGGGGVAAAS
jgi:hypothetical protein